MIALPSASPLYPRWKLVLECFFDDSGKQGSTNFVTIAGFLADTSYWSQFLVDWRHLNSRWQISNIHMKNLMMGVKEFADWDAEKKKGAVAEYVQVINKHKLIGYGVAVDAKFWNKLPRSFQKPHGNAQEFCFERIIMRIKDLMVKSLDRDFISVTFDYDSEFAKQRLTRFQKIVNKDPWAKETMVNISFAHSWAYPPLQAADMLAWETNRMLEGKPSFRNDTMFKGPDGIYFSVGELWDEQKFHQYSA